MGAKPLVCVAKLCHLVGMWPEVDQCRDLIRRYASAQWHLREEFGDRALVLPNAKFFPDAFAHTESAANTLLSRIRHHAGMGDIPMRIRLSGDVPASGGNCSSGSCAAPVLSTSGFRLEDDGDSWLLHLAPQLLAHPVGLTTLLSRCVGAVFIEETRSARWQPEPPQDVSVEVVASALGLGALLMEGAYVYSKSCGGPQIGKATRLGVGELALLVTLFAGQTGTSLRRARKALSTTQAALLREGQDWLAGNKKLLQQLERSPEELSDGLFEISAAKPHPLALLGFGRKPHEPTLELADVPELTVGASAPTVKRQSKQDDSIRALVAEALSQES